MFCVCGVCHVVCCSECVCVVRCSVRVCGVRCVWCGVLWCVCVLCVCMCCGVCCVVRCSVRMSGVVCVVCVCVWCLVVKIVPFDPSKAYLVVSQIDQNIRAISNKLKLSKEEKRAKTLLVLCLWNQLGGS